jgi:ABC-type multidrug transport system fused ATPase/permease subunit
MFFYDASVVLLCLAVLLPVIAISYKYGKKMKHLNKLKNDELEHQVDVITRGDAKNLKEHYNNLRSWQIKTSDQEAWNFGFMEFLVMIVLGVSLLITYKTSGAAILAGNVVGIFFYVTNFAKGLETIPYTVQRLSSLTDITRRIELQVEDFPEDNNTNGLKPIRKGKVRELAA